MQYGISVLPLLVRGKNRMPEYRIMIVDDETEVREGIASRVDWKAAGFTIVATAENGQDALEKAEFLDLDVVLTDIKMPYMDGLALGAELLSRYPATKLIILSGFDEFEYAKEAIKLNVLEYVLKPVNADWIVNSKSDRFYKVRDLLNSAGDKYPSVPCKRMLLNQ